MGITRKYLNPPQIARDYGINVGKVLAWIRAGELAAIDISIYPGVGKPRWRITPYALADFERARSNTTQQTPQTQPRRRKRDVPSRVYV